MFKLSKFWSWWLCYCLSAGALLAQEIVVINRPESANDTRGRYFQEQLQAALEATVKEDGPFEIRHSPEVLKWERAMAEAKEGSLDVLAAATRPAWEQELLPVRIPLDKGLLGYRIFLIRQEDQPNFRAIQTLEELKKLGAGSQHDWSITKILEQNGFNVVKGSNYEGLFTMLADKRFDYFPRGLNEALDEYAQRLEKFPNLHVEESIVVRLPLMSYFFVSPKKPQLAARLEKGLNQTLASGEFDQRFLAFYGGVIRQAKLGQRQVFSIENPNLTPETPLQRRELWFDPAQLKRD